ncbi:MAG: putative metal-binding motif-containing protein, partial [bacterium]|nr:putative metal-binding motif-containing protein [bacterium]
GLDNDCDGSVDEGCTCQTGDPATACGPDAPACNLLTGECLGECAFGTQQCVDGEVQSCSGGVFPVADACDLLDNDCDGDTDEDFDLAGDTANCGTCGNDCLTADNVAAAACMGGDCAITTCRAGFHDLDGDPANGCEYACHPTSGGTEQCDRIDNDCDGTADEDFDLAADTANCGMCGNDCEFPNASAMCVDSVCTLDACDDGFMLVSGSCLRCEVDPPTTEVCDAAFVDEDCDGVRNEDCVCANGSTRLCGIDLALHRRGECVAGTQACAGGTWGACEGATAPEPERCDGLDNDCSGGIPVAERDTDDDGFMGCEGDCDNSTAAINPDAVEVCDGIDNNCDGATDEGFFVGVACNTAPMFGTACQSGQFECDPTDPSSGSVRCSTDTDGSDYPVPAPAEICENRVDDDCNGIVDEDCGVCDPATDEPIVCGVDLAQHDVGECHFGFAMCDPEADGAGGQYGICTDAQGPMPESCDGLDNNCDGGTDEDFDFASDPQNCGTCGNDCLDRAFVVDASCTGGMCGGLVCHLGFQDLNGDPDDGCEYGCFVTVGGTEQCDRIDNDCDGTVDEDPACAPPASASGPFTFAVTLPGTQPLDATAELCQTWDDGVWSCGDYALSVSGSGGRTLSASGTAVAGFHIFNLCTAQCDTSTGVWAADRGPSGLVQAAAPDVTWTGFLQTVEVIPNSSGGGNWFTEFAAP